MALGGTRVKKHYDPGTAKRGARAAPRVVCSDHANSRVADADEDEVEVLLLRLTSETALISVACRARSEPARAGGAVP
jgi:hypothetical protein